MQSQKKQYSPVGTLLELFVAFALVALFYAGFFYFTHSTPPKVVGAQVGLQQVVLPDGTDAPLAALAYDDGKTVDFAVAAGNSSQLKVFFNSSLFALSGTETIQQAFLRLTLMQSGSGSSGGRSVVQWPSAPFTGGVHGPTDGSASQQSQGVSTRLYALANGNWVEACGDGAVPSDRSTFYCDVTSLSMRKYSGLPMEYMVAFDSSQQTRIEIDSVSLVVLTSQAADSQSPFSLTAIDSSYAQSQQTH